MMCKYLSFYRTIILYYISQYTNISFYKFDLNQTFSSNDFFYNNNNNNNNNNKNKNNNNNNNNNSFTEER